MLVALVRERFGPRLLTTVDVVAGAGLLGFAGLLGWRAVARVLGAARARVDRLHALLAVLVRRRGSRRSARIESPMPIVNATAITARLATGPIFTMSSISSFTPTSPSTIAIVSSR